MKKIISISLALILLLGNIGLTYGTHMCGGHAVISEVMHGEQHLDCGMGMMDMQKELEGLHFSKPPCCENQYLSLEIDELVKNDLASNAAQLFVAATIATLLYTTEFDVDVTPPTPVDTSPHFVEQDFQVLHQIFLI